MQDSGELSFNSSADYLEQTSNDDLCQLFLYAHATGLGTPADKYTGFNSPSEISSDGLMNFFLLAANGEEYYDEKTQTYAIPSNSINDFLSGYFEGV